MFGTYHPIPGPSNQAAPSGCDYTYKCRVCLDQGKLPIFGPAPNIADALSLITAIHVGEDKPFPRFLCFKCHSQLQGAIKLRKTAQNTDVILKKITSDAFFTDDKSQYYEDDLTAELAQKHVSIKPEAKYCKNEKNTSITDDFKDFFCKPEQIVTNVEKSIKVEVEIDPTSAGDGADNVTDEPDQSIMMNNVSKKANLKSEDVLTGNTITVTDANNDDDLKLIQCEICMKHYVKIDEKQHMVRHKIVKCWICKASVERNKYHSHVQRVHKSNEQKKTKYICEICGKELSTALTYDGHKTTHSNEFPFKCDLCPYQGRNMGLLRSHKACHDKEYRFQCSKCPSRFQRSSYLRTHLRTHGEKKYKCESCPQAYYTPTELKKHQDVVHLGIRDVLCNICGKDFGTRNRMMKHQLKVHKRKVIPKGQNATYLEMKRRKDQEDIAN